MRLILAVVLSVSVPSAVTAQIFSIEDAWVNEGDSGLTALVFTVSVNTCPIGCAVLVSTEEDEAEENEDYLRISAPVPFPPSPLPQTASFTVWINGDTTVEGSERLIALLTDPLPPGASISDAGAYGTIVNDDSAALTVEPASADEGGSMSFAVSLSRPVDRIVSFSARTVDGTATTADNDYTARSETVDLVFVTTGSIWVQTRTDAKVELNETFTLELSNLDARGRDVTLATSSVTGIVYNDDSATLSIGDVGVDEGDTGPTPLTFTVRLDRAVDVGLQLDWTTAGGSARAADGDYNGTSGVLSFAGNAGETKALTVQAQGDRTVELDETFEVRLSNLTASGRDVSLETNKATGEIRNDDSASVTIASAEIAEGNAGESPTLLFEITLDRSLDVQASVKASTVSPTSSPTPYEDYVPTTNGTLFLQLEGTYTVPVLLLGDATVEMNEVFELHLSDLSAAGRSVVLSGNAGDPGTIRANGTIINDDSAGIVIGDVTGEEPSDGFATFAFPVTLDRPVDVPVYVYFATTDGTATVVSGDYVAFDGSLAFDGLESERQLIEVDVLADDDPLETNETFFVDLVDVSAGSRDVSLVDTRGEGTIRGPDGEPPVFTDGFESGDTSAWTVGG